MKRYLLALAIVLLPTVSIGQIIQPGVIPGGLKRPSSESSLAGTRPAFPEAQGYGAMALSACDRSNVQVLQVTNLTDSVTTSGSLRWALDQSDNTRLTIITFRIAGYIVIGTGLSLSRKCVYIAGQTAPGSGITIRSDGGDNNLTTGSSTGHTAMRYITLSHMANHWIIRSGAHHIFDHISTRWSTNALLTVTKYDGITGYSDVTLSRILHAEALNHPVANIISAVPRWNQGKPSDRVSVHNNLYVTVSHRNPLIAIEGGVRVINNVVYNWNQSAALMAGGTLEADVINNYYKPGPRTNNTKLYGEIYAECGGPDTTITASHPPYIYHLYAAGNIGPHNSDPNADNFVGSSRMVGSYQNSCVTSNRGTLSNFSDLLLPTPAQRMAENGLGPYDLLRRRFTTLAEATIPITIKSAQEAYTSVVTNGDVGNNARVSCDGTWITRRDVFDARKLNEVITGTSIVPASSAFPPAPTEPHPAVDSGSPCTVSNADGIPDAFKIRYGLSIGTNHASIDTDGDGYTDLEEYVNGTNPRAYTANMR